MKYYITATNSKIRQQFIRLEVTFPIPNKNGKYCRLSTIGIDERNLISLQLARYFLNHTELMGCIDCLNGQLKIEPYII